MNTTRRGFFGVLTGALAGPSLLQAAGPSASLPQQAEAGHAVGRLYRYSGRLEPSFYLFKADGIVEIGDPVVITPEGAVRRTDLVNHGDTVSGWATGRSVDGNVIVMRS